TFAQMTARGESCDGDEVLGGDVPLPPGTIGSSSGDPHLMTFDRVRYDAQAVGELILAHDTVDDTTIQVRTRKLNSLVAVNDAVAAKFGPDVAASYADGTARITHAVTEVADGATALTTGTLYRHGVDYVVVWPDNSQLHLALRAPFLRHLRFYVADGRRG